MRILIIEPGKHPRKADISHNLYDLQKTVGGYIQAIYPWEDRVALVCDEEGLLKNAPFNRLVAPQTAIFGTFFICGLAEEEFDDLPDDLMEKYSKLLYEPEVLFKTPIGLVTMSLTAFREISSAEDED